MLWGTVIELQNAANVAGLIAIPQFTITLPCDAAGGLYAYVNAGEYDVIIYWHI